MKILDIIVEVGDKPYPYSLAPPKQSGFKKVLNKIVPDQGKRYRFFTDSGLEYMVWITPDRVNEEPAVQISFALIDPKTQEFNIDTTNTGDVIKILSTVYTILKDYIKQYDPSLIIFYSKDTDSSRIRLYNYMVSKIQNWLPNYRHSPKSYEAGAVKFILRKIDKPQK